MKYFNSLMLKRGIALYIDLIISTAIAMVLCEICQRFYAVNLFSFVMIVGLIGMILRDIFGRSIGKRIMRLHIVDTQSKLPAKPYQRILRNLTSPLTVIELLIIVAKNDNVRIGDMLAKTSVQEKNK